MDGQRACYRYTVIQQQKKRIPTFVLYALFHLNYIRISLHFLWVLICAFYAIKYEARWCYASAFGAYITPSPLYILAHRSAPKFQKIKSRLNWKTKLNIKFHYTCICVLAIVILCAPSVHFEHFAYLCVAPVATLIWGRNLERPIPLKTFGTRYSPLAWYRNMCRALISHIHVYCTVCTYGTCLNMDLVYVVLARFMSHERMSECYRNHKHHAIIYIKAAANSNRSSTRWIRVMYLCTIQYSFLPLSLLIYLKIWLGNEAISLYGRTVMRA